MAALSVPRWLFPVLIIVLIGVVVGLSRFVRPQAPPQMVECANLQAGCSASLGKAQVDLGVRGQIKVLKPFQLWVRAPGAVRVQASFAMKDMDMGFNLYTLHPGADGTFQVRVILPVCVSGRRDWYMLLDVDGRRLEVPFVTEL